MTTGDCSTCDHSAKTIAALRAENEALRCEARRMRHRIESLRGALKTASGWVWDGAKNEIEANDRANRLLELAGDMELAAMTEAGFELGPQHRALTELCHELERENAMLRQGDTCARQCEGTAYRIEGRRLLHHLTELAKFADRAALVLATIETENDDETDQIQQIIDGISTWAPPAMLGTVHNAEVAVLRSGAEGSGALGRHQRRSIVSGTGGTMKRELRYTVLKNKDVEKYLDSDDISLLVALCDKATIGRYRDGKPALQCVVVESDWPEYEPTWAAIGKRVDGLPADDCVLSNDDPHKGEFPRQRNGEGGWTIDADLLYRLAEATAEMDDEFRASPETVELVLLALERAGVVTPNV